jgi:predicted metal-binding protein
VATFTEIHRLDREAVVRDYLQLARDAAIQAVALSAGKIRVRSSVRMKCQIPLCEHYGTNRACPPLIPELATFREALQDYEWAFLLGLVVSREAVRGHEPELALDDFVCRSENWALGRGYYWGFGLTGGACYRCPRCEISRPCPFPFRQHPSPEGMGIDITMLAREVGWAVDWPPKDRVHYFALFFL